ncbi:MAG: phosphoribosylformylglycinamidine synthase subunit PurS, partial [Phycisphaerales bacterium]
MDAVKQEGINRWCVRVHPRAAELDGHGRDMLADAHQLGLSRIESIRSSKIYFLQGALARDEVTLIASNLLADPVAEKYECMEGFATRGDSEAAIEV